MKTNIDKLVAQQVKGSIHHPTLSGWRVGYDGQGRIIPSVGGITYDKHIGDSCMNLVGDHVEPGVSLQNKDSRENAALQILACVGNEAKVVSGDAKGAKGVVVGTHGGIEHCFIEFDDETLEKLNTDDTIVIKAFGQGLQLESFEDVTFLNLDPRLLDKMVAINNNQLDVKVSHIVPAELMGSGLGSSHVYSGDYDIMTQDPEMNKKYNLDSLRFGDIVAVENHYSANGPHYLKGAYTIGVIVHSDSFTSGHGPGLCVLMSAKGNRINPIIDNNANLKNIL